MPSDGALASMTTLQHVFDFCKIAGEQDDRSTLLGALLYQMGAEADTDIYDVGFLTQGQWEKICLLYTSPSPRDRTRSRMPSSA